MMNRVIDFLPGFLFIILFTITGLVPNYGALDRIGTQWFYLSVINTLGLIYVFYSSRFDINFKTYLKFKPLFFFLIFTIWGLISYFYSINSIESIVKFFRIINIPISLFLLMVFMKEYDFDLVKISSVVVIAVLIIELYFSYSTYFQLTTYTTYNFSYANLLKGATGNKNITSASLAIKLPFVFYLVDRYKSIFVKSILSFLIFVTAYLILLLSARATIIALIGLILIPVLFYFISTIRIKNFYQPLNLAFNISPILIGIILFQLNLNTNNSASIVERASTINLEDTSTQQRLRYYKHAVNQILKHPFVGVGYGNWKVASIEYDKKNITGYTVPYHTHNDFLEIGAELGIIGLATYMLIFLFPLINILKRMKKSFLKEKLIFNADFMILLAGFVFFIDSNLNFPHARPVNLVPLLIILSFLFIQNTANND